ncbi:hypothetical protein HZB97_01805, partial [Candidatus Gottesmanbacteria bacterium]|nr:hypothetical protein [Candidatus Gottesmanbacteria bacterium]
MMHKSFYASGFLYHPASQQILLQQPIASPNPSPWALFEGPTVGKETPEKTFRRLVGKSLGLKINLSDIYPVYFYHCGGKDHHIIYAQIKNAKNFSPKKGVTFGWFTFKEITKLPISAQDKHDIV